MSGENDKDSQIESQLDLEDSESKSSSEYSLLAQMEQMRERHNRQFLDPKSGSFQLKKSRLTLKLGDHSERSEKKLDKKSYIKSNYSNYKPNRMKAKDFQNISHLKNLKQSLHELSMSVEEGSIN
jgi:hypothetical protein